MWVGASTMTHPFLMGAGKRADGDALEWRRVFVDVLAVCWRAGRCVGDGGCGVLGGMQETEAVE